MTYAYSILVDGADISAQVELLTLSMRIGGAGGATFRQRYGRIISDGVESTETMKALAGKIATVTVSKGSASVSSKIMLVSESDTAFSPANNTRTGDASFSGVEYYGLLMGSPITEESPVLLDSGRKIIIKRLLPFNSRVEKSLSKLPGTLPDEDGTVLAPNMAPLTYGSPVFSDKSTAIEWTAADVADFLLYQLNRYHKTSLKWASGSQHTALRKLKTGKCWNFSGKSYKQAFDELFSPREGWVWTIEGDTIAVWAVATSSVTASGKTYLPAAKHQLDFDADAAEVNPTIAYAETAKYDTIEVVGSRIRVEMTLSAAEQTLVAAWDESLVAKYNAIADDDARKQAQKDDKFAGLWCSWKIAPDWNGVFENKAYIPALDQKTATPKKSKQIVFPQGWTIERERPPAKDGDDPAAPLLFALDQNGEWRQLDNPGDTAEDEDKIHPVSVAIRSDRPVLSVHAPYPHLFARNASPAFSPADNDDPVIYDADSLTATISVLTDEWFRLVVGTGSGRTKRINVPEAQLWLRPAGTVTGLKAESGSMELDRTAKDEILRSDKELMQAVATMAKAWYGRRRCVVSAGGRDNWPSMRCGHLVKSVVRGGTATATCAVVTDLTFDLQALAWSFQTDLFEPDFEAIAGRRKSRKR